MSVEGRMDGYVQVSMGALERPGEHIRLPGAGVTGNYEILNMGELNAATAVHAFCH